ncbi:MAG: CehA/McbA family metallohydrolase [Rubripirellula sp.]|nr:CehA/McbA family metallohydrolase [Rubripirellula sp.]
MKSRLIVFIEIAIVTCFAVGESKIMAAQTRLIAPGTEPAIEGKEVDWIYGDYLLKNDKIALTIASPVSTRDANMTIRNIGGSILDLTLNEPSNDQLSAYTPTAGRYMFHDPSLVTTGREGDSVFWQCLSTRAAAKDGTTATIRYRLKDGDAFVTATVLIEGEAAEKINSYDGVRADGWFTFEKSGSVAYCADSFFRQTIGFQSPRLNQPPRWIRGRPYRLQYADGHVERSAGKVKWTTRIYPATSLIDLMSVTERADEPSKMHKFSVQRGIDPADGVDAVNRAQVTLQSVSNANGSAKDDAIASETFTLQTDDQGVAHARLTPGAYIAIASAIGYESTELGFQSGRNDQGTDKNVGGNASVMLTLGNASGFVAEVKDGRGKLIPVKATIYAADGNDPNYGLSSARTFVENLVYSVHGRMSCPLDPGKYEIYFSRGPEYNSVKKNVEIVANQMQQISVQLDRVVDTTGWVSADLHSHSSPSGDNTSDQFGRVENLLCENIEFAPCTEHNRIDSYLPHLQQMKLTHLMATCTGIELTGSPTPVNHQNSFPLHWHPHTQNGGGPRSSSNPVVQIERLAMWDQGSDKLVQMNHPNLHQIYGDVNTDGVPDQGFRGMLEWTDVVEVHPLETIFRDIPNNPPNVRRMRIPMFQWLQLLNQGRRIPGVINTDSHYNHHGSGWRRNWIASSTDDPGEISTEEMVRQAEAGHIVMSTGPFLSVAGQSSSTSAAVLPGDDLDATDGKVTLKVSVQCPNWLDVNRVQVFINGRPSAEHNFTRKNSPELFGRLDDVRKFDSTIRLRLDHDAHLIVATIGEGTTMEKIMGTRYGRRPPIAVSNPIFVNVNGDSFQPNGDDLGMPLPSASLPAKPK